MYLQSMNTVLQQELIRFNLLLNTIRNSLVQLRKAIEGTVVMSIELEEVYIKMNLFSVSDSWHKVSYPSLKPLSSWIEDFLQRILFMQHWLDNGQPTVYWLSGFFFTQSFLTGTAQNYARTEKLEIDTIQFRFEVLKEYDYKNVKTPPSYGSYIYGLYLEGANWSPEKNFLIESAPKILYNKVPLIWFKPYQARDTDEKVQDNYSCPVYKTTKRAGVLSTTGHSTNFVLSLDVPTGKDFTEEHWIKRGVAMIWGLND